jgi:hypothetical protein
MVKPAGDLAPVFYSFESWLFGFADIHAFFTSWMIPTAKRRISQVWRRPRYAL